MRIFFPVTRLLLGLVSYIPLTVLYLISDILFFFFYHFPGYRRKVVRENLNRSFPGKSEEEFTSMERAFYRHFCDVVVEFVKIPSMSDTQLLKRVQFTNPEVLEKFASEKRSLIAVTSHMNNWEWGGMALPLVARRFHCLGIYKPLANPSFNDWFRKTRGRTGMELVAMKSTLRAIMQHRDWITLTTLISDQTPTLSETDYVTSFMGTPVPVFTGAEKIAKLTNYPVIYFDMRKRKRGFYEVEIILVSEDPSSEKPHEITKKHLRMLEKSIRSAPGNWLWSHRRWKHAGKSIPGATVDL